MLRMPACIDCVLYSELHAFSNIKAGVLHRIVRVQSAHGDADGVAFAHREVVVA